MIEEAGATKARQNYGSKQDFRKLGMNEYYVGMT